ncbi:hypothetical protein AOLI_G00101140 [Acnodon oligacanthus]
MSFQKIPNKAGFALSSSFKVSKDSVRLVKSSIMKPAFPYGIMAFSLKLDERIKPSVLSLSSNVKLIRLSPVTKMVT